MEKRDDFRSEFVERRQFRQCLNFFDRKRLFAEARADENQLFVGFCEFGKRFSRRHRILRVCHCRRALEEASQGAETGAFQRALGDKIQRSGALLVKDDGLSDEARRCDEPSCLRQLAQEFGADVLVAARMEHQSRFDQLLKLWMFDTTAVTLLSSNSSALATSSKMPR